MASTVSKFSQVPCQFIDLSQEERAPNFTVLSSGDQHRYANDLLEYAERIWASGYKIMTRSTSEGKRPLEFHVYCIGERRDAEIVTPVHPKGCPFDGQLNPENPGLVQKITTLSGNVLLVLGRHTPHLLACNREEIVEFYKGAEQMLMDGNEKWSGSTLSQVGVTGGQTVAHAHLHITKGISPKV